MKRPRPITVKPAPVQIVTYAIVVDRHIDKDGRRRIKPYLYTAQDGLTTLRQARRLHGITQTVYAPELTRIVRVTQTKVLEVVQ